MKRKRVNVELPNGQIIQRVPKVVQFGNFQQMIIRYKNSYYLIGDGDEYLRGCEFIYKLGKRV